MASDPLSHVGRMDAPGGALAVPDYSRDPGETEAEHRERLIGLLRYEQGLLRSNAWHYNQARHANIAAALRDLQVLS